MRNDENKQLLRGILSLKGGTSHRCAYICNSGKHWLIFNSDEQLGTTEIDPAVRSSVA